MAITRSMSSGATKKIEKVPKQKSKPKPKSRTGRCTIETEAFEVFMVKDVAKRYYQKHPLSGFMSDEATVAGHEEWAKMTDAEKNVWIEYTKRRLAEGVDKWDILVECSNAYSRCIYD